MTIGSPTTSADKAATDLALKSTPSSSSTCTTTIATGASEAAEHGLPARAHADSSPGPRSGSRGRPQSKMAESNDGARLDNLPDDVLGIIFGQLDLRELVGLGAVSRGVSYRVSSYGIPLYLSSHRLSHLTLAPPSSSHGSARSLERRYNQTETQPSRNEIIRTSGLANGTSSGSGRGNRSRHTGWPPLWLVKHNHQINRSLSRHLFHATQIGPTWTQAVIPTLNVMEDWLVLGVGAKILAHPLRPPQETRSQSPLHSHFESQSQPQSRFQSRYNSGADVPHLGSSRDNDLEPIRGKVVHRAREYPVGKKGSGGRADIVGIVTLPPTRSSEYENDYDDGYGQPAPVSDPVLVVAQFDGTIQRMSLPSTGLSSPRITARYSAPPGSARESVHTLVGSTTGDKFMSTTISGQVHVHTTQSPWIEPTSIQLSSNRAWSSHLVTAHPTLSPTAFLGVQGGIDLHALRSEGLSSTSSRRRLVGPEEPLLSSPYDIQLPSLDSSHHPSLLLSAWYDSHLRIHDLRTSSTLPVMSFSDPYTWADGSAFYSACWVGGHHIAGGGARHGTVSLFDMRNSKQGKGKGEANESGNERRSRGWSVFSPGGKGSPVYKLKGEGGKIWGVTEKRSFVLSFDGSGLSPNGIIAQDLDQATAPNGSGLSMNGNGSAQGRGNSAMRGRHVPSGWKGRGGKWTWTVKYGEEDQEGRGARGYEHVDRSVELFDSLVMA